MSRIFICCLIWLLPTSCFAFTGAEFLQASKTFASGYALGVVEARTGISSGGDDSKIIAMLKCVANSHADSSTLYDMTVAWIKAHPATLQQPAFAPVLQMLTEMCGPK